LGRFGKLIAIPLVDCAAGAGRVWAAHERNRLRGAPAIDGEKPLTREQELALCEHYGIPAGYGRAAEVSAREQGAITSHRTAGGS
jgi:hypothetical protein